MKETSINLRLEKELFDYISSESEGRTNPATIRFIMKEYKRIKQAEDAKQKADERNQFWIESANKCVSLAIKENITIQEAILKHLDVKELDKLGFSILSWINPRCK